MRPTRMDRVRVNGPLGRYVPFLYSRYRIERDHEHLLGHLADGRRRAS
jgi:hypothetical protein